MQSSDRLRLYTPISAYLLGKVFTYRLNANMDAQMARLIIRYIKTGSISKRDSEATYRVRQFLLLSKRYKNNKVFLLGVAYTLERINGLVDFTYAHHIEKVLHSSRIREYMCSYMKVNRLTSVAYNHTSVSLRGLTRTWKHVAENNFEDVKRYARLHNISVEFSSADIINAIICVQQQNIIANRRVSSQLLVFRSAQNEKVRHIRQLASTTNYPRVIMRAAMRTELSAARWDGLLITFLRLKMKNI